MDSATLLIAACYLLVIAFVVLVVVQWRASDWRYATFEQLTQKISFARHIYTVAVTAVFCLLSIMLIGINLAIHGYRAIESLEIIGGVALMGIFAVAACYEQRHVRRCVRRQHKLFLAAKAAQPTGDKVDE